MILAGDVGGTKTLLALFDPGPPLRLAHPGPEQLDGDDAHQNPDH